MEHTYSVLPLMEDHFEERIADIVDQYKRKITSCPLFLMKLVPEGNPVWDKADRLCKIYARYRDVLKKEGVPSAILVQATFGHGNALETPAPFQRMIGFNNGVEENVYCPIDPSIIEYLSKAMKRIAKEHPKAIMLDDDVRLLMRPFEGCACPYHMKEFNRMNNTDMTRAELLEYVKKHPKNDALTASFERLQTQSLVNAVKAFRTAIDSVDPSIQGINCTSGDECDSVIYTNPVFAGKNNPTIVRVPNGTYAPLTTKGFSDTMRRAAVCGAKLRGNGIDIVLAETDTVPFNRYAKNARYLHAHFTASILEGLKGAKHWLTRTSGYDPKSGVAFRNILAEHSNYYEEVAKLADGLRFVGANSAFIEQKHHVFCVDNIWCYNENTWATCVFERLGIPFYFSDQTEKASFLEGNIVREMSDEQIQAFFNGSVFCANDAASDLIERGYGNLLGVSLCEYTDEIVKGESFDGTLYRSCAAQRKFKKIVLQNENAKAVSYCYAIEDSVGKMLAPAVSVYERENGKLSVVFCGTPNAPFTYNEGFAFLNEGRKKQFVELLKQADALPVYCESDNELCLRAGYAKNGQLLVAIFNLGYDPEENVTLYLEKNPKQAKLLGKDGNYTSLKWETVGENTYAFNVKAEPLYPVVMLID